MPDSFNLQRFIDAQASEIEKVRAELRSGRKTGHWMWFIFPQMKGLGSSWMSNYYGISSREEAEAYLSHPTLGARLIDCTELVNLAETSSAVSIFGHIDSIKFRSSMTLFAALNSNTTAFARALDKYFSGEPDQGTLTLLQADNR